MTTMTRWVLAHKRLVVGFWVVMTVAAFAAIGPATKALSPQFTVPGREGFETNHAIGRHGVALIERLAAEGHKPVQILTHCNAGALATLGWGTATAPIYIAHAADIAVHVWVSETRPRMQGARLTAWELAKDKIPVTLITDNMAGYFLKAGEVDAVIVGADRIAANGDVANKIGTYMVAVAAHENNVPFYVAAPLSTVDLKLNSGDQIPIELRAAREVTHFRDQPVAPEGIDVANPAFDVTPHRYISAIITDAGVAREPYDMSLGALFESKP